MKKNKTIKLTHIRHERLNKRFGKDININININ